MAEWAAARLTADCWRRASRDICAGRWRHPHLHGCCRHLHPAHGQLCGAHRPGDTRSGRLHGRSAWPAIRSHIHRGMLRLHQPVPPTTRAASCCRGRCCLCSRHGASSVAAVPHGACALAQIGALAGIICLERSTHLVPPVAEFPPTTSCSQAEQHSILGCLSPSLLVAELSALAAGWRALCSVGAGDGCGADQGPGRHPGALQQNGCAAAGRGCCRAEGFIQRQERSGSSGTPSHGCWQHSCSSVLCSDCSLNCPLPHLCSYVIQPASTATTQVPTACCRACR
jgi:hypothetical protein